MKKYMVCAAVAAVLAAAPGVASAGDWELGGSLTASVAGTDNALLQPTTEEDDTIWSVKGDFTAGTRGDGGSFVIHGSADKTWFADFTDEGTFDWDIGFDAEHRFGGASFTLGADHNDGSEDRHGVTARRDTHHPTEVVTDSAYLGLAGRAGDVELSARVDYAVADYKDDRHRIFLFNIDQDHRDRATMTESLRATFTPDADVSWFAGLTFSQVDYDLKPPFVLHNRDSDGWSAVVGVDFEMTDQLTGSASVGWGGRSFSEAGFSDVDDIVIDASLTFKASPDTTFKLAADRDFEETTQIFSSVYVSTTVRGEIDHSFSDRWSVGAYAQAEWADHEQVDREDTVSSVGVSVTYGLSENAGITASWDHYQLNSDGIFAVSEYDENRFGAAITWRF